MNTAKTKIHQVQFINAPLADTAVANVALALVPEQVAFSLIGEKNHRSGVELECQGFRIEWG
jgi:hypothetical protein